jgi:aryl-alcohol dehydrogenase-like predicted oxidoreductase
MKRWSPTSARAETLLAVDEYVRIAENANLTHSQLALAFVQSRPFVKDVGSGIVRATTLKQLKENLEIFVGTRVSRPKLCFVAS